MAETVDQRIDPGAESKVDPKEVRSVTLLVTPNQAAKLDLAQNLGTLHLSLRNANDKEPTRTEVATANGLKFFQGKPLDERLKELWEGAYKLLPDGKVPKEALVKADAPPLAPLPAIRTSYGTLPGMVHLQDK